MSVSLHTAVVGTYLQIVPRLGNLVDKAEAFCADKGLAETALTTASLAPDQWNFAKQVMVSIAHSAGAIEGVGKGVVNPDLSEPPTSFAALRQAAADALAVVQAVDPQELDAIAGRDMRFEFGERRMDFTVSDYLLSFALPNFYFHTTTAYAVLRNQGVPLGKMDFLGAPRLKV